MRSLPWVLHLAESPRRFGRQRVDTNVCMQDWVDANVCMQDWVDANRNDLGVQNAKI